MQNSEIAYIVSMGQGLEAFIYREIEYLESRGQRVRLFATKIKRGDIYDAKASWPVHIMKPAKLLIFAPYYLWILFKQRQLFMHAFRNHALVDFLVALEFSRVIKNQPVRQIHSHFGDHKFFIGFYCKKLTGLPLTVTIHAHEFYTNPNEQLFRIALQEADLVLPIAEKWRSLLVSEYGVDPARVRLSKLFVDPSLCANDETINVLAVGRYTERKGFEYLIEAIKLIRNTSIRVLFVGFGDLDLRGVAVKHGVANQVTVFGKMDQGQLRVMYSLADILCVPSITTEEEGAEGIPVVLMEGMACGLPVIATDCGAIRELVGDGVIPERDVQAIADEIMRLASSKELREQEGRVNRSRVEELHGVRNLERLIDIFGEVR